MECTYHSQYSRLLFILFLKIFSLLASFGYKQNAALTRPSNQLSWSNIYPYLFSLFPLPQVISGSHLHHLPQPLYMRLCNTCQRCRPSLHPLDFQAYFFCTCSTTLRLTLCFFHASVSPSPPRTPLDYLSLYD